MESRAQRAEKGFTKLANMEGGMLAWESAKLPVEK